MSNRIFSFLFLIIVFSVTGCQGQTGAQKLSPDSFEKKLTTEANKIILDVRTPDEYNKGHLADAVMIDFYKDDFKSQVMKLDKSKPVFVYCAAGGRSSSASKILTELGFKQVYDLQGGLNAWSAAKKPVEK